MHNSCSASRLGCWQTLHYSPKSPVHGRKSASRTFRHPSIGLHMVLSVDFERADPRLRHVECLEQRYRVAVGHAREKITGRGVKPFLRHGALIEELDRTLANFLPEA